MAPDAILQVIMAIFIFVAALLYSSVGNGGAAGYLAIMALSPESQGEMKHAALVVTIIVALVATTRFYRQRVFRWRTFWPFALTSAPAAYIASGANVPIPFHDLLLVIALLYAAALLLLGGRIRNRHKKPVVVSIWLALLLGAIIGFFSGLVGIGGGILFGPMLIVMNWADQRTTYSVSAVVLTISIASALASSPLTALALPGMLYWMPAALLGSWLAAEIEISSWRVDIRRGFSIVLAIAAINIARGLI